MLIGPSEFVTWLHDAFDRLDELGQTDVAECSPLIDYAGKAAARLGYCDLYSASQLLVEENNASQQEPARVTIARAYKFLSQCIGQVNRSHEGFVRRDPTPLSNCKRSVDRRFQSALSVYRAAEEVLGTGIKARRAYDWALESTDFRSMLPPSPDSFERYVSEALRTSVKALNTATARQSKSA
jgi:hypothetical protein